LDPLEGIQRAYVELYIRTRIDRRRRRFVHRGHQSVG
jgi:hypothetical protein